MVGNYQLNSMFLTKENKEKLVNFLANPPSDKIEDFEYIFDHYDYYEELDLGFLYEISKFIGNKNHSFFLRCETKNLPTTITEESILRFWNKDLESLRRVWKTEPVEGRITPPKIYLGNDLTENNPKIQLKNPNFNASLQVNFEDRIYYLFIIIAPKL